MLYSMTLDAVFVAVDSLPLSCLVLFSVVLKHDLGVALFSVLPCFIYTCFHKASEAAYPRATRPGRRRA